MVHRVDLHIHSCYSLADGLMAPRTIVRLAKRLGYDAIAVTDHYTHDKALRGTIAAQRIASSEGLTAYRGLEYSVVTGLDRGHVLLYFDHVEQVPPRGLSLVQLLEHAELHHLTVVQPHPFGFAGIRSERLFAQADFWELNGSYGRGPANRKLVELAERADMRDKLVAFSDAHARGQMGSAVTEVGELHDTVADTLSTCTNAYLGSPRRSWGRAAKMARTLLAPGGLAVNMVQKARTRRALSALDAV